MNGQSARNSKMGSGGSGDQGSFSSLWRDWRSGDERVLDRRSHGGLRGRELSRRSERSGAAGMAGASGAGSQRERRPGRGGPKFSPLAGGSENERGGDAVCVTLSASKRMDCRRLGDVVAGGVPGRGRGVVAAPTCGGVSRPGFTVRSGCHMRVAIATSQARDDPPISGIRSLLCGADRVSRREPQEACSHGR